MRSRRSEQDIDAVLLEPIMKVSLRFFALVVFLLAIVAWGVYGYIHQFRQGLGVTGLNQPISWGFYVTNFVFFIGISHAGTLISAILRICQAEWRRPITRMAEVITGMVLAIGALNILVDLGRPDRLLNVLRYGRLQSPLLWDATSLSAYFTASLVYLWLPMIPDIAIVRDSGIRGHWIYRILAIGWRGTKKQQKVLNRGIAIMAIMVIPIAVSVHSVVSFVFSMTLQPMWHSTIFGPYFVAGAIFSGIAALVIAMVIVRKVYHFENYLKPVHFHNLGSLLLAMALVWSYFTFSEYLTSFYGNEPEEMQVFWLKFSGAYAPYFWAMVACNFVIPMAFLCFRKTHTIGKTLAASISICIGMWLERFIIVVPSLASPRLDYGPGVYFPTWVEWSETAGCFALFILLFALFSKVFPLISIWEIREARDEGMHEMSERLRAYLPDTTEGEGGAEEEDAGEGQIETDE